MFYHPNDNKATIMAKYLVITAAFFVFLGIGLFLIIGDVKIPQKEITVEIEVKNRVNICMPEDEKIFEKSFFGF